jgi:hypothetical protein
MIRWGATDSVLAGLQGVTSARVILVATGATSVTVGTMWAECSPKAQLVVIDDGAYYSEFMAPTGAWSGTSPGGIPFVGGYPDLKALGVPVVWAPDTSLVGQNTGSYAPPSDRATWAQLAAVMGDGNGNEMNYHGSSGNATASMTSAQIVTEVMTAIKQLEQNGYQNPPIKAAWSQNQATNASAAHPYMLGSRNSSNNSGSPVTCWPPEDMYGIPCQALDSPVTWSTVEANLQATNGVCVAYVHRIDDTIGNAGSCTTRAQWGAFLDFIQAGLSGGWLQPVTFLDLLAQDGLKFRRTEGDWTTEYFDATGTVQRKRLP